MGVCSTSDYINNIQTYGSVDVAKTHHAAAVSYSGCICISHTYISDHAITCAPARLVGYDGLLKEKRVSIIDSRDLLLLNSTSTPPDCMGLCHRREMQPYCIERTSKTLKYRQVQGSQNSKRATSLRKQRKRGCELQRLPTKWKRAHGQGGAPVYRARRSPNASGLVWRRSAVVCSLQT